MPEAGKMANTRALFINISLSTCTYNQHKGNASKSWNYLPEEQRPEEKKYKKCYNYPPHFCPPVKVCPSLHAPAQVTVYSLPYPSPPLMPLPAFLPFVIVLPLLVLPLSSNDRRGSTYGRNNYFLSRLRGHETI